MSNILNIRLDEFATFTKVLTFTKLTSQGEDTHPITGVVTKRFNRVPLPLTGFTFRAQIKDRFDNPTFTETMQINVLDAATGRVTMGLSKEQTARVADNAPAKPTGTSSERTFRIGYYDVVATTASGDSTRVIAGEVYLSKGVSVDPRSTVSVSNAIQLSPTLAVANNITLAVDRTAGQNYVGIRYFSGGVQVTPTAGSVEIFRKPTTSNAYLTDAVGTLQGTDAVGELLIDGNTAEFRAEATGIQGADSYQVVVSSN